MLHPMSRTVKSVLAVGIILLVVALVLLGVVGAQLVQIQTDWAQTDQAEPSYLRNKPEIPADARVGDLQADWNETDPTSLQYIQGRPTSFGTVFQGSYDSTADTDDINLVAGDIIEVDDGFYLTLATSITEDPADIKTDTTNFHRIDQAGGGGLTAAQVLAEIRAKVQDWAEASDTTIIPADKLPTPVPTQSPSQIATAIAGLPQ